MTPSEKRSQTARKNHKLRKQKEVQRRFERETIKRGLLSVLDSDTATTADKLRAAELLREYRF